MKKTKNNIIVIFSILVLAILIGGCANLETTDKSQQKTPTKDSEKAQGKIEDVGGFGDDLTDIENIDELDISDLESLDEDLNINF